MKRVYKVMIVAALTVLIVNALYYGGMWLGKRLAETERERDRIAEEERLAREEYKRLHPPQPPWYQVAYGKAVTTLTANNFTVITANYDKAGYGTVLYVDVDLEGLMAIAREYGTSTIYYMFGNMRDGWTKCHYFYLIIEDVTVCRYIIEVGL